MAGVTRNICFREPKPMEAWECRQAQVLGKLVLSGYTIQTAIGITISQSDVGRGHLATKAGGVV